ncbi:MAG: DUF2177 family protein [Aquabacterium sp.]
MGPGLKRWLAALATLLVIDALWLGLVAAPLYRQERGALFLPQPRWLAAAIWYLGYPLALVLLALRPPPPSAVVAAGRGALVGAVAYGTYDLTNLATLVAWPAWLAALDVAFGVTMSAAMATAAWWVDRPQRDPGVSPARKP